jgi:hypothetical protein
MSLKKRMENKKRGNCEGSSLFYQSVLPSYLLAVLDSCSLSSIFELKLLPTPPQTTKVTLANLDNSVNPYPSQSGKSGSLFLVKDKNQGGLHALCASLLAPSACVHSSAQK